VSTFFQHTMKKSKDLRLRIEPKLFNEFSRLAKSLDMPVSQVLRRLITQFIEQNLDERQNALFPVSPVSTSQDKIGTNRTAND